MLPLLGSLPCILFVESIALQYSADIVNVILLCVLVIQLFCAQMPEKIYVDGSTVLAQALKTQVCSRLVAV